MATTPFQGAWSTDTQFTGNAVYVIDASGTVWLAADTTSGSTGAGLYSSPTGATNFTLAATIPNVSSPALAFDPAITIDAAGTLHIVGQVAVTGGVVLQKFTYVPSTNKLSGPFPVTTGGIVGSDYDIVALANGNTYVVSCLITGTTETIQGFEITPTGIIANTDLYLTQPLASGSRYGSVSLWTPDGLTTEIYLGSEPKSFHFDDTTLAISVVTRDVTSTLSAITVLTTVTARYASGRLTVLGNGSERWIVQGMYTQVAGSLISNAVLGHLPASSAVWSFQAISGTVADSIIEPVLSISPTTVVLALIDANPNAFAHGGPVKLYDVNPIGWILTPRTDFPYPATASLLRGSKTLLPDSMPWGFLAQQNDTGVSRFYSGYNAPPTAVISPASETCQRGVTYTFDASGSSDINLDTLQYSWVVSDPTGQAVFQFSGTKATLLLPASVGPAEQTLVIIVSVLDVDSQGHPLHPMPSAATSTLIFPQIPVPTISALGPIAAGRNSSILIAPVVVTSPATSPTYLWTQTGGTSVLGSAISNQPALTIQTNGAAVAGEILTFQLTVNDGVNTPVSASFQVVVTARTATGETHFLARATFAGTIGQRNVSNTWSVPVASATVTGFTQVKRAPLVRATAAQLEGSYILIGPASVVVQSGSRLYHVLTPDPVNTILDAEHSYLDQTILLTSAGQLLLIPPNALGTDTDNAVAAIDISDVSTSGFVRFTAAPPYMGERVLILSGPPGCLLLVIDDLFQVHGSLFLSANGEHLYGASSVQWVRAIGVESLHKGVLLIGTVDAANHSYETEFDLSNRTVVSVLDSSKLLNQVVTTGELLFAPVDSYSGYPTPPILLPAPSLSGVTEILPNPNGTVSFTLSWKQSRTDLVTGYTLELNTSTGYYPLAVVGSGEITSLAVSLPPGATYQFRLVTNSLDGDSLPSNVVSVTV